MTHDFHPPQRWSSVSFIVVIMVLAAVAGAISLGFGVGTVTAQTASNETTTGNNTTGTGTDPVRRVKQSLNPTNTSGSGGSANGSAGNTTGNETGYSPGVVEMNGTWGEYVGTSRNGTNTTGSGGGGSGGGGGGVVGTVVGAASWGWDALASVGDTLALGGDETVGKTVSAFFNGARAFFSWMLGFFVKQGLGIVNNTIDKAVKAMSMTPHPNRVNNFYHNPTNDPWGAVYATFQQTGKALARLLWLLSLGYVMVAGNQFGVGTMSYAKEKQTWVGLAIATFFITDAGWTLTNIVPHVVDVFTQAFTNDITTTPLAGNIAKGMVVLFVLLLIYFELSAVVLLMVIAAFRILVIIGFAPFIPALVVALYSPFGMLSWIAKAGLHLWLVLLVSAMPSAILLNASFSMAQAAASGDFELLGTIMVIPLIVGGLLASALMPFLLWKASSKLGSSLGGSTPGSKSSPQWREKMTEYRQKAARPNRFQRGFRRKEPVEDNGGTGAHRAGKATRNAPRNTKQAAGSAKQRAASMRNKLSELASRS